MDGQTNAQAEGWMKLQEDCIRDNESLVCVLGGGIGGLEEIFSLPSWV